MRILMLNHNVAWSGGTFFRAFHFARQLVCRGHQVTLLTISPKNRFRFLKYNQNGVDVLETPDLLWGRGRTGWDSWDMLHRVLYVQKEKWDLVHAFDSRPVVAIPAFSLARQNIPIIMDWADWWGRGGTIEERTTSHLVKILVGPLETYFEEVFRTKAQGTTVISSSLKQRAIDLGVNPKTIIQIPNGSDIENVFPLNQEDCRQELGFPMTSPIVGYLGVLTRSDAELLFSTFSHLLDLQPECILVMIGNHKAVIPNKHNIIETGFITKGSLVKYLGACDLMLLPLKNNIASQARWPSKINDYLAAGKPIVASAVGDTKQLFIDHQIGLTTEDKPESLAKAANELLVDRDLCEKMGRNARFVAENIFSWPILSTTLESHYLRTLGVTSKTP